ncbi:hypothetical protein [Staphylothermus hellenicus]|uniref:Uncharacterized protein n=1 Tax=Staphylothermus hellenicus (strain DSM 12710 / JCM 10830 / BK20S6-10-b1 / P8) TaxID=591019 RepID=D7D9G7_STAHD|nr:hypothetical protein [Staphylothermus hellenicus]ADI32413.1 hypothetical protein Shell_1320 [Staphylothermus hellenicus DSM 12710]
MNKLFSIILVLVIAGFLIISTSGVNSPQNINAHEPEIQEIIKNNVPIYYLGHDLRELQKIFENIYPLQNKLPIGTHILIVEGAYASKHMEAEEIMREELLRSVPIIIINGHTEILRSIIPSDFKPEIINGRSPINETVNEAVYGYLVYSTKNALVQSVFISTDPGEEGIIEAYKWAVRNTVSVSHTPNPNIVDSTYKTEIYQLSISTGNSWFPYGRLEVATQYYKLINDYSNTYDWYIAHIIQQSVPGDKIWGRNV